MTPEEVVALVEQLVKSIEAVESNTALLAEALAVEQAVKALLADNFVQSTLKGLKADFNRLTVALTKKKA